MYHEEKKFNYWLTTFSVVRDLEVLKRVCNMCLYEVYLVINTVFRE